MQSILNDKLIGLYLYGSLATGDFDTDISDIDLLAALSSEITEAEFSALQQMHLDLIAEHPGWDDRLEIAYLTLDALQTFKTKVSPIGIISPGEPFHFVQGGKDWLMNWYMVREVGVTLFGPLPAEVIAPISNDEFLDCIRGHIRAWPNWLEGMESRPSQAYAILTMCRGLYTLTHGKQVSKRQAALWAAGELPEWSTLIQNALLWRATYRQTDVDHAATLAETRRFVHFVVDRISSATP